MLTPNKIFAKKKERHERTGHSNLEEKKKNRAGGIGLCDFRQYYKARVWSWHKNRLID